MTSAMMNHMPLNTAYLCQDCDAVGNCSEQCPACASRVLMGLAGVFDRKEVVQVMPIRLIHSAWAA